MKTPLFLPAAAVILLWVSSSFYSFQKTVSLSDWGYFRFRSAWGSTSLYVRKYSPSEFAVPGPSLLQEGLTRYESFFNTGYGVPEYLDRPKLSVTLTGIAELQKTDPRAFIVSLPYWMLALLAMTPAVAFVRVRSKWWPVVNVAASVAD